MTVLSKPSLPCSQLDCAINPRCRGGSLNLRKLHHMTSPPSLGCEPCESMGSQAAWTREFGQWFTRFKGCSEGSDTGQTLCKASIHGFLVILGPGLQPHGSLTSTEWLFRSTLWELCATLFRILGAKHLPRSLAAGSLQLYGDLPPHSCGGGCW